MRIVRDRLGRTEIVDRSNVEGLFDSLFHPNALSLTSPTPSPEKRKIGVANAVPIWESSLGTGIGRLDDLAKGNAWPEFFDQLLSAIESRALIEGARTTECDSYAFGSLTNDYPKKVARLKLHIDSFVRKF